MCAKNDVLNNIFSLIEKKKEELKSYQINEHEGGVVVQNFDSWDDFMGETKMKYVHKHGEFSENKEVQMIFAKKGTKIPLTNFGCKKTYIFLLGKIRYFFEEDEDIVVQGVSTMEVSCNTSHGGEVLEDAYVVVLEEF